MRRVEFQVGDKVWLRKNCTYQAIVQEVRGDRVRVATLWYAGLHSNDWWLKSEWVGPAEQVAVTLMEEV